MPTSHFAFNCPSGATREISNHRTSSSHRARRRAVSRELRAREVACGELGFLCVSGVLLSPHWEARSFSPAFVPAAAASCRKHCLCSQSFTTTREQNCAVLMTDREDPWFSQIVSHGKSQERKPCGSSPKSQAERNVGPRVNIRSVIHPFDSFCGSVICQGIYVY